MNGKEEKRSARKSKWGSRLRRTVSWWEYTLVVISCPWALQMVYLVCAFIAASQLELSASLSLSVLLSQRRIQLTRRVVVIEWESSDAILIYLCSLRTIWTFSSSYHSTVVLMIPLSVRLSHVIELLFIMGLIDPIKITICSQKVSAFLSSSQPARKTISHNHRRPFPNAWRATMLAERSHNRLPGTACLVRVK